MIDSTKLESLFELARRLPEGAERQSYLEKACGSDRALRSRVELLLRFDLPDAQDPDAHDPRGEGIPVAPFGEAPGDRIDRYKLLQTIGEGGFGTVWMAEQHEPVKRRVALKVIKLGMDTKQVIARFDAERQALALMDHPNIARVLDAGATEAGRPFFVMELVHGVPLLEYCDAERVPTRERLALFVQVCHAIQHAHQKGIIHRDIKPSNVLLTQRDGVPVPKVIDFGVAKATNQELTELTLFTELGQIIGTPAYMAPEQAEMSELGVDTRADVYALGVLLYELLTGTTPFSVGSAARSNYPEVLRAIREDEPERPSTRASSRTEAAVQGAARRGTDVRQLGALLRGDLDWIVLRCLEKDRARRYGSAAELAEDIERHLADEPVRACPPTWRYRLQKVLRRHRKAVLAMTAIAVLLVLGTVGTTVGMLWALKEKGQADVARIAASRASYGGLMLGADAAQRQGNTAEARRLHRRCPEPFRGWEWYHLDARLRSEPLVEAHEGAVRCVAYSPDGQHVVSGGEDGELRIWDTQTLELVRVLARHPGRLRDVAYDAAGGRILSTGTNSRVWDAETGEELLALEGYARFVADGQRILSLGADKPQRLWDSQTGDVLQVVERPDEPPGSFVLSADGRLAASPIGSGDIRLWDTESGEALRTLAGHSQDVWSLAFSPAGRRLASGSVDTTVRLWEVETGAELRVLEGHDGYIYKLAFSPDGQLVVSGSQDETLRLWSTATGEALRVTDSHGDRVSAVAFRPDGRGFVSGAWNGTLGFWQLEERMPVHVLSGPARYVLAVAFSPDGRRIATGSQDGLLRIYDAVTGDALQILEGHDDAILEVAYSPDGRHIVSSSWDGTLRIWDAATGETLPRVEPWSSAPITGSGAAIFAMAVSPDGRRIASTGAKGTFLRVVDAQRGEVLREVNTGSTVYGVAFSPDARSIASCGHDGLVELWDAETLELVRSLPGHEFHAPKIAFSPDGRRVAATGWDKTVRIWDADSGEALQVLVGHRWLAYGIAFSPDGQRVLTSGQDKTVRVWDPETGDALQVLEGHTDWVYGCAFSPDGRRIASVSGDGTLRIWDSNVEDARAQWRGAERRDRLRPRIRALFDEHGLLEPVLDALQADASLTVDERRAAARMARADEPRQLEEQAWSRVDPDRVGQNTDVVLGLELARASVEYSPRSPDAVRVLAWSLYANGLHEEAIEALEKACRCAAKQNWGFLPDRRPLFQAELARLRAMIE